MADQRTMAQLLQAPTEGYEDAIVVPAITADNFELNHGLLTLVQNKPFCRLDKEDPHAHIRYFNKITSTLKSPNVSNTSIKLMLFPFSLEGASRIWLEKEPPRRDTTREVFQFNNIVTTLEKEVAKLKKEDPLKTKVTALVDEHLDVSLGANRDEFMNFLSASLTERITEQVKNQLPQILPEEVSNFAPLPQ
ncbi:hypothetical protein Tco_0201452 [Tanacetum coccineum]